MLFLRPNSLPATETKLLRHWNEVLFVTIMTTKYLSKILILLLFLSVSVHGQEPKNPSKKEVLALLGVLPSPPKLQVDTLERVKLDDGWRYKIKYLAEDSSAYFHTAKILLKPSFSFPITN